MRAENVYLLSALPVLGEPGTPPPIQPAELLERVAGVPAAALVRAVLRLEQLRAEPTGGAGREAADAARIAHYRAAAEVARRRRSAFLAAWVGAEAALELSIARLRARALGLEPPDSVAADLAEADPDLETVPARWAAEPDPLAGLILLLRARWDWLSRHEPRYSFHDDEVAAYALRLALLCRWHRVARREPDGPGAPRWLAEVA